MISDFKSSKETASWLVALARIHIDDGELGKAETVYNDALLLAQKTYGIESGLTMLVLKDLKAFYLLTNQSEKVCEIENSIMNHKRFIN
ncbi:MAG: tetratricopeptide repeat protein [Leptolyngbya sp.]|nr:tetratricopeptide repeat protein [Candidatus Melainabacteria bacterium]